MSGLQCLLGNGNNLLQLWKKYEVYAKSNRVRPEQVWRLDQEKQKSWSQARTFWKSEDVLPCEANAQESQTGKTRRPSYNTLKMVRRWRVQEVTFWNRMERTPHHVYDRIALETHPRRHESWKNSKFETLDSHDKCRRTSTTTQSTTRLCSSEKRMQTTAWRAPGKNPTRIRRFSSQPTTKTAKRATIWRPRRPWLRRWPEHR